MPEIIENGPIDSFSHDFGSSILVSRSIGEGSDQLNAACLSGRNLGDVKIFMDGGHTVTLHDAVVSMYKESGDREEVRFDASSSEWHDADQPSS